MPRAIILLISFFYFLLAPLAQASNDDFADDLLLSQANMLQAQVFEVQEQATTDGFELEIKIPEHNYIYRDSIKIESQAADLQATLIAVPQGIEHNDAQGTNHIISESFKLKLKLYQGHKGDVIALSLQGCSSDGICFPPQTHNMTLQQDFNQEGFKASQFTWPQAQVNATATSSSANSVDNNNYDDNEILSLLGTSFVLALALAYVFGILLNLTPCVLPMLPIFSAMLQGNKDLKLMDNVKLNLSYALGLSITYMLFGLLLSFIGSELQAVLQSPIAIFVIAGFLFIFALSCAGLYDIKVPSFILNKLQNNSQKFNRGTFKSAFLFGVISSILATPCTSAPLAGVVLYILQDGNLLKGTLTFFIIGLGMATPLFIIGVFGINLMRKMGKYTQLIKEIIALALFASALHLIEYYIPELVYNIVLALIIAYGFAIVMLKFIPLPRYANLALALIAGILITVLPNLISPKTELPWIFTKVNALSEISNQEDKNTIYITFSASWCANCHAMERAVYRKAPFINYMQQQDVALYEFDATNFDDPRTREALNKYGIVGVPAVVIVDKDLNLVKRRIGLQNFDEIKSLYEAAKKSLNN